MGSSEIGAEQVAPFSTPNHSEFISVQSKREGLRGDGLSFCWQMKVDQPVSMSRLFLSCAEFEQQLIARQFLLLELMQAFEKPFQPPLASSTPGASGPHFSTGYKALPLARSA